MAFENIGLGVSLSFDGSKFSRGIKQPRDELGRFVQKGEATTKILAKIKVVGVGAFRALGRSMGRMSAGIGKVRAGLQSMTFAFAPLALGVGVGAKKFVDFQQQLQNVKSVSDELKGSPQKFAAMAQKAKQLGATTQFTATQAAEGFELMSRQGFSFQDQMDGIGGVLALAAADSIELSQAADIAGNTLQAFGLKASEMNRVADVLALTSASANTNVLQLGEAFKTAAPLAAVMRVPLEDTAASLGLIANAGIKGSASGTAFKNMLIKLANPSTKGAAAMKEFNLQIFETDKGALDLNKTMKNFIEGTRGIESATERAKVLVDLFGLRAPGAVNALSIAIENGKFDELPKILENAEGSAKKMAAVRLDSFQGQVTLLASAAEGFAIEFFGPFVEMAESGLKETVIPFVQDLVTAIQFIQNPTKEGAEEFNNLSDTVKQVAFGVLEAIDAVKNIIDTVVEKVKFLGDKFEERFGPNSLQTLTKWGIIFGLVAAAMVPVLIAVIAIGFAISAISTVVSGVASVISGAFLPILVIGGVLVALFFALREENESFGETVTRVWGNIKVWALDVWENAIKPFWEGVVFAAKVLWPLLRDEAQAAWTTIKIAILETFDALGISMGEGETDWLAMGKLFVKVIANIAIFIIRLATTIVLMVTTGIKVIKALFEIIVDFLFAPFVMVKNAVDDIVMAVQQMFAGDIIGGLKRLGAAMLDFVLAPMKTIIAAAIKLADAVGLDVPDGLRSFATETTLGDRQTTLTGAAKPIDRQPKATVRRGQAGVRDAQAAALAKQQAKTQQAEVDASAGAIEAALNATMEKFQGEGSPIVKATKEAAEAAKKSPCIDNNVSVAVDGAEVARGQSRHEAELKDRAGFKTQAWQQRMAAEFGSAPVRGKG